MSSSQEKQVLVSGIQATGRLHIGNYFGAMKQFVDLQDMYDAHIFVANYHSLTTVQDGALLRKQTRDVVLDYLAIGLDPQKVTLYTQTSIPELFELTWIFNTLVTVPWLERAHAFKDKESKGIEPSVGLFDYPILQAADIVLPGAHVVPVGEDQRQHIEMTREIVRKCNAVYGTSFIEPQALINDHVAVVPGIDGQKMSKSYNNTIPLFGTDQEITKAVMGIVTDSALPDEPKDPETNTIFKLYSLIASVDEIASMRQGFLKGGMGYGDAKKLLAQAIIQMVTPMRERRAYYEERPDLVDAILQEGGARVRERAGQVMADLRKKAGLV
ncbi:MAG: tryptophan--tRNA ligase [Candidatus Pacebacteria bacterium]|nr:tryptophan--tRNA ligase [Candidatus Paceibacterota bacterium]MCD8507949.1 tryptophan--tRNA ligase [Candidatus Paceibacterota bacterium]MCD8563644.1 tryptophan--tRNA ligase [Candidatus Paceibacterota bacterium]